MIILLIDLACNEQPIVEQSRETKVKQDKSEQSIEKGRIEYIKVKQYNTIDCGTAQGHLDILI